MSVSVGIEAINIYGGSAFVDVRKLSIARGLDMERFDNLLIKRKTVSMHYEDPVSYGVNAAKPIVDQLSPEEKNRIELIIVTSESGIDFAKSISTYCHDYLGLSRHCRSFEMKQACYSGTAALQMAVGFILSQVSPGAKALVIASDVARPRPNTYAEPTQGAASVAMLIGENPKILTLDVGANGYYTYEVMDTCRPSPDFETGDPDLSLLSYLDCAEHAFIEYKKKVGEVDYQDFFDMLSFHTPFGGLVKGVHRTMMRKFKKAPPAAIEEDFKRRVEPSFQYCQEVGNIYGATVFLATIGHILNAQFDRAKRLGIFSYGSGCCSEFYSAIADQTSQDTLRQMQIGERLASRYEVSIEEYDQLLVYNQELLMGTENKVLDFAPLSHVYQNHFEGRKLLVLNRINNFHREYAWT